MTRPDIQDRNNPFEVQKFGIIHLAFSTGSKEKVDKLTENLKNSGYKIVGEPRTSGDDYYESVIFDLNIIKIIK